jgi:amino acid transporter
MLLLRVVASAFGTVGFAFASLVTWFGAIFSTGLDGDSEICPRGGRHQEGGWFPVVSECHFGTGATQSLLPWWINPLIVTFAVLSVLCLIDGIRVALRIESPRVDRVENPQ